MLDANLEKEIRDELERLPLTKQREALEFVRTLNKHARRGVAGSAYFPFANPIDRADLDEIAKAIEDGCERIDQNEW